MELNNNDIAAMIGKAVGEAVTPLYERMNALQKAIKPQHEEPEFPHAVWDRAKESVKSKGNF